MAEYNWMDTTRLVPQVQDLIDMSVEDAIFYSKTYTITAEYYMSSLKSLCYIYNRELRNYTIIKDCPSPSSDFGLHDYHQSCYELALSQIKTARELVSKICSDYCMQIQNAESSDDWDVLRIEAIGCLCTVVTRIGPSLSYLGNLCKNGLGGFSEQDMKQVKEGLAESTRRCSEDIVQDPYFLKRLEEVEKDPSLRPEVLKWLELVEQEECIIKTVAGQNSLG